MPDLVIEESPMNATMALEIKRALMDAPVFFKGARRALEIDMALEAIIQGRMKVVSADPPTLPDGEQKIF